MIHHGNCVTVMADMPEASVDAIVCDPPYGLEFMGKEWDSFASSHDASSKATAGMSGTGYTDGGNRIDRPSFFGGLNPRCRSCGKSQRGGSPCVCASPGFTNERLARSAAFGEWCQVWTVEALRVLKPGGHLLAFGGTRTAHRLACAIEDAGFEIRDSIAWMYGSGFPKSLDVSKAIDKAARGVPQGGADPTSPNHGKYRTTTTEGKRWDGDSGQGYGAGGSRFLADGRESGSATGPAASGFAGNAADWQGWGTALKPSHEPLVWGIKSAGHGVVLAEIGSHLDRLENEWLALDQDLPTRTGAAEGSPGQTGTSQSESAAITSWNTVTSWKLSWAELSEATNTSTTSTASRMTTDLRTLSSYLAEITATSMLTSLTNPSGPTSIVSAADNLFASVIYGSRATLAHSADETATAQTRTAPPAGTGGKYEPIVVARKPLVGTVAANVLAHGTGALNIDGCRIEAIGRPLIYGDGLNGSRSGGVTDQGRWPANVVLDEDQAAALDQQSGISKDGVAVKRNGVTTIAEGWGNIGKHSAGTPDVGYGGQGGASRFFYCAKAPKNERPVVDGIAHPTVKPLTLMRWLVRLVTPPGGVVLDPFAGSGTTIEAAILEGFTAVGIEQDAAYLPLIQERIRRSQARPDDPGEPTLFEEPA